ncbi:MAG: tRNA-dihydrouridine synthase family protein [Victivallales bacterium]|nr:tRNA-dihydrouridine synthase family protein [Victivallales bacterium]
MIYNENALILAPLSGYTDIPYRHSARRHGCRYAFTEMIDAGALVFANKRTARMTERAPDEQWLGAQILGSEPTTLEKAVKILNQCNFDVIDFNLGCPAPKVLRKGEGAKLAENISKASRCIETIAKISVHPVSAKIRIIDENDPAPTIMLAKKIAEAGAEAITVHARIKENFYSGTVQHHIIKEIKNALQIQIIANGGVKDLQSYCEIRTKTLCDKIMVARGAMGNPWIFSQISEDRNTPPSPTEIADEIQAHIEEMASCYGIEKGLVLARKIILDYLKGKGFPRQLKTRVIKISNIQELNLFTREIRELSHLSPCGRRSPPAPPCPAPAKKTPAGSDLVGVDNIVPEQP